MSIAFQYQPQQQLLQRQRLPFAVLGVAVAVVEVVVAAAEVVAGVDAVAEHGPVPGRGPAACVHGNHVRGGSAW